MSKTVEENYLCSTVYDNQLSQISHLKLHPGAPALCGENYDKAKIVLIGESHYVENKRFNKSDFSDWYKTATPCNEKFNQESVGWFNTRHVICERYLKNYPYRAFATYRNPARVLSELFEQKGRDVPSSAAFTYFSFFNFFQRPEIREGKSFEADTTDIENANEITLAIVNILQPKAVVFLSSYAFSKFAAQKSIILENGHIVDVDHTVHPSCGWWGRNKGAYGKEKFKTFISTFVD